jgi:outer membrane protein assembly factor BamB
VGYSRRTQEDADHRQPGADPGLETGVEADKTIADVQVLLPAPETNTDWSQPGGNAAKSMGQLALAAQPQRLWQSTIDGGSARDPLTTAPVVAEGKLFVVDVDGNVIAMNADTGAKLWSTAVSEGEANRSARFGGGVSYDSGTVFATDGLGDVIAASAADGKVLWRAKPAARCAVRRRSPTVRLCPDPGQPALCDQPGRW